MSNPVRIGLAGLGTVGATVAERLLKRAIAGAELVAVSARDTSKDRGIDLSAQRFETDPLNLIADDVDVVVASKLTTLYILLLMSLERYLVVMWPFKSRDWCFQYAKLL